MEQVGEKYCNVLEKIVKCSICHRRLTGNVTLCEAGHSACRDCLLIKKNQRCPHLPCGKLFTSTQNFVAEELLCQLDRLKVCLMESDASKYKLNCKKISNDSPELHDNEFRCRIGDNCRFTGDISKILRHFQEHHDDFFEEIFDGKLPFRKSFDMNYFIGKNVEQVIKIKRLIFIIHISVNGNSELGVCILMYASRAVAEKYACQIEIECTDKKSCYKNAKVISACLSDQVIRGYKQSGLQIARNKFLYDALKTNKRFKCTIILKRKSENDNKIKTTNNEV